MYILACDGEKSIEKKRRRLTPNLGVTEPPAIASGGVISYPAWISSIT